jgi:hypothetical protein
MEKRIYYSTRNNKKNIDVNQLYKQLQSLFLYYRGRDYFKEKLDITTSGISQDANHKAMFEIKFMPFPIDAWESYEINEENIFDTMEFLFHHVSKPGELTWFISETNYNYQDYEGYDEASGRIEIIAAINMIISDYRDGYEITNSGEIVTLGKHGVEEILNADIIEYDIENVDSKVKEAIRKWKNRSQSVEDRRQAIIDLANVFEWLKKTEKLGKALDKKDESLIFEIANKFELRHHNPEQVRNYDKFIWYSWMFHFYLATYHAVIRTLKKQDNK